MKSLIFLNVISGNLLFVRLVMTKFTFDKSSAVFNFGELHLVYNFNLGRCFSEGFKSGVRQQQCSAHIFKIIQRDASKCGDLAPVGKLFECREILYLYLSLYRCQFVHSTEA